MGNRWWLLCYWNTWAGLFSFSLLLLWGRKKWSWSRHRSIWSNPDIPKIATFVSKHRASGILFLITTCNIDFFLIFLFCSVYSPGDRGCYNLLVEMGEWGWTVKRIGSPELRDTPAQECRLLSNQERPLSELLGVNFGFSFPTSYPEM